MHKIFEEIPISFEWDEDTHTWCPSKIDISSKEIENYVRCGGINQNVRKINILTRIKFLEVRAAQAQPQTCDWDKVKTAEAILNTILEGETVPAKQNENKITTKQAMEALLAGKKVRYCDWPKGYYIYLDKDGDIHYLDGVRDQNGKTSLQIPLGCGWEIYDIPTLTKLEFYNLIDRLQLVDPTFYNKLHVWFINGCQICPDNSVEDD